MNKNLVTTIARVVCLMRHNLGISQEELAHRSELDRTYISGIERGVRNVTLNSLQKVISGLGMEPDEFLKEVLRELELSSKK